MRDSVFKVARHVTVSVLGLAATLWTMWQHTRSREGRMARSLVSNEEPCPHGRASWRACESCCGLGRVN